MKYRSLHLYFWGHLCVFLLLAMNMVLFDYLYEYPISFVKTILMILCAYLVRAYNGKLRLACLFVVACELSFWLLLLLSEIKTIILHVLIFTPAIFLTSFGFSELAEQNELLKLSRAFKRAPYSIFLWMLYIKLLFDFILIYSPRDIVVTIHEEILIFMFAPLAIAYIYWLFSLWALCNRLHLEVR